MARIAVDGAEDGDNSAPRDNHASNPANTRPGQRGATRGRPGKRRGPRSLGRYPWLTYSKRFLSETAYAASTRRWMARTLDYTHRAFQALKRAGIVSTTNPAKLTAKD